MVGTVEAGGRAATDEVAAFDDTAGAAKAILEERRAHTQEERLIILTNESLRSTRAPFILQRSGHALDEQRDRVVT
jgi:hypothetical protein